MNDNHDRLRCDIRRLVGLWFGDPFVTPTFDEYAMFMAFSAGLRSADLSRQVGAVITREKEILATGANECPSARGGLYWAERNPQTGCIEDAKRGRDYKRGGDSNRIEQLNIIQRIIEEAQLRLQMKPLSYLGLEYLACEAFGKKVAMKAVKGGVL